MKICYIASVRIPDERAAGLAISKQCEAFGDIGHEITLFVPARFTTIKHNIFDYYKIRTTFSVLHYKSIDLMRFWNKGFYIARLSEMIFSGISLIKSKNKYDIIYSRDQWMLLGPVVFGLGKKSIVEMHTKHSNFVAKYVLKRVKKVIVISQGLKSHYEELTGRSDVSVVPSGVNLEQFEMGASKEDIKKLFNLPTDKVIFGYVGKYTTLGESKGVNEIIRAYATVHKNESNTHLLIVGLEETEKIIVKKLLCDLDIPDHAVSLFSLRQDHFSYYVAVADVLLMNYPDSEHYAHFMSPTKLFAYLASGQPIISSDLPSIRFIASNDEVIFVEPNNIEKYAIAMLDASKNLSDLGKDVYKRKMLARKYDWKERANKITQIFYD